MSVALKLYDELRHADNDEDRARLIAEAFESFEDRYPNLQQVVTRDEARATELRLQKEIEGVRLEIKRVEATLGKEIKEVELRLTQAMHRQTLWVIGSIGTILALLRMMASIH